MELEIYTLSVPPEVRSEAAAIEARIKSDRAFALAVANYLDDMGGGATGKPGEDALALALALRSRNARVRELLDTYIELAGIALITGLGVAGIFDPSGVADAAAGGVAVAMTRYGWSYAVDAGLSFLSIIPFADILTKPAMAVRLADKANDLRRVIQRAKAARQTVAAFSKAAKSGSKALDDVLAHLRAMPRVAYGRMTQLKAHMARRGVHVWDGAEGARALDKMGHPDANGMFIVFKKDDGSVVSGMIFRDQPTAATVHHELWHRNDFIRNHGSDFDSWAAASTIDKERYVHNGMTGSRRWNDYPANERANQVMYQQGLEQQATIQAAQDLLKDLGVNF